MKQPNKKLWSAVVALIIAGSAGISLYKGFADSTLTVNVRIHNAVKEYRARPEIQMLLRNNTAIEQTIKRHTAMNDSAIARGRGALYNDAIGRLNAQVQSNNAQIERGEAAVIAQFGDLRNMTRETSAVAWAGKLAISITMPLCAWLLAMFSTRTKDLTLANIQFVLSFVCEFVSAYVMHDGILIMLNDGTLAIIFATAACIVLPFVYKGVAAHAFSDARSSIVTIFTTEQLPNDWREFVIRWRRAEVAKDLTIREVASFYQARGVKKLSSTKLFNELTNGKIVPLNFVESDLNQLPTYQPDEREE